MRKHLWVLLVLWSGSMYGNQITEKVCGNKYVEKLHYYKFFPSIKERKNISLSGEHVGEVPFSEHWSDELQDLALALRQSLPNSMHAISRSMDANGLLVSYLNENCFRIETGESVKDQSLENYRTNGLRVNGINILTEIPVEEVDVGPSNR